MAFPNFYNWIYTSSAMPCGVLVPNVQTSLFRQTLYLSLNKSSTKCLTKATPLSVTAHY